MDYEQKIKSEVILNLKQGEPNSEVQIERLTSLILDRVKEAQKELLEELSTEVSLNLDSINILSDWIEKKKLSIK